MYVYVDAYFEVRPPCPAIQLKARRFCRNKFKLLRMHVGKACRGEVADVAKSESHSPDLSCAQSTEGDGNVQPRVSAGGARHEHARVSAGFSQGLCCFWTIYFV